MYPVSDAFHEQLQSPSRRWATKVDVMLGDVVTSVDAVVMGGYIGMDELAVRRELHITFVDADGVLTPTSARDLLAPKGTEIRPWRGLWIEERGEYEWVPLGVFGIVQPEVRSHSEGVVITVKGFDRVDSIRKRRFIEPWVVTAGSVVETVIANIVTSRMSVPVKITPTGFTVPEVIFDRLSDPWAAVSDLAEAAGMTAHFDPLGSLVIGPAVDIATNITYGIGPRGLLLTCGRKMDADDTYNGVSVRTIHPDKTIPMVEKWDTDPNSPTYYLGPFGKRPYGYASELINSVQQAQNYADVLFARKIKMRQEVEITTMGGPQHDVFDKITVNDPRSKTFGDYTVISATIPLRIEQGAHIRLRCREAI